MRQVAAVVVASLVSLASSQDARADEPTPPTALEGAAAGGTGSGEIGRYVGATAPPPGGWRFMLSDLTLIRLNPLGLETRARLGMQKRLYPSQKLVSQNNFMFLGAYPKLNPATASLGLGGEIQPLSIINLRAMVEVQQYFGTFGFLQSFTSPTKNFSDAQIDVLENTPGREPQATSVFHVGLAPLLQLRVGKIAVRSLLQLDYWDMKLRAGDTVAYEPTFDTSLPDGGWTLSTDTDILYTGRPGLAIGIRHTLVHALYQKKHFADTSLSAAENEAVFDSFNRRNSHQRIGLFAAYTMRDRGPSKFNKPTVILILSWYLSHRFRAGAPDAMRPDERADDFTGRAVPYFLLGYAFESDFLSIKR